MSMYSDEEINEMSVTDLQLNLELFFGHDLSDPTLLGKAAEKIKAGALTWDQVEEAVDGGGLPGLLG